MGTRGGRERRNIDGKACLDENVELFGVTSDRTTAVRIAGDWHDMVEGGVETVTETWCRKRINVASILTHVMKQGEHDHNYRSGGE